jgi:hypothetical protein
MSQEMFASNKNPSRLSQVARGKIKLRVKKVNQIIPIAVCCQWQNRTASG